MILHKRPFYRAKQYRFWMELTRAKMGDNEQIDVYPDFLEVNEVMIQTALTKTRKKCKKKLWYQYTRTLTPISSSSTIPFIVMMGFFLLSMVAMVHLSTPLPIYGVGFATFLGILGLYIMRFDANIRVWRKMKNMLGMHIDKKMLRNADREIDHMTEEMEKIKGGLLFIQDKERVNLVKTELKTRVRKRKAQLVKEVTDMLNIALRTAPVVEEGPEQFGCWEAYESALTVAHAQTNGILALFVHEKSKDALTRASSLITKLDDGKVKETQDLSVFTTLAEMQHKMEEDTI